MYQYLLGAAIKLFEDGLKPYVSLTYGNAVSILDWGLRINDIQRTFLDVQHRMEFDMGVMISKSF